MSKFAVILPAAGKSSRFSEKNRKKPFLDLKGRAVWLRSVDHFINRDEVIQTILVISKEDMEEFKLRFQANLAFLDLEVVEGGEERADSVANALKVLKPDVEFIAVHDAARPLMVKKWVDDVFEEAKKTGAAIPGIPVTSTLKHANNNVIEKTVSRDSLWQAQTPQVFRRDILEAAFENRDVSVATDESQLVEASGHPVSIVEGSPYNIKITTSDDFQMAKALVDALPNKSPLSFMNPFADEEPGRI